MVWRGHAFMHSPHDVHFSWSMWARKDAITGASFGQTLRHFVHPIQATPHSFMAIGPRSRLAHATQTMGRSAANGVTAEFARASLDAFSASGAFIQVDVGQLFSFV